MKHTQIQNIQIATRGRTNGTEITQRALTLGDQVTFNDPRTGQVITGKIETVAFGNHIDVLDANGKLHAGITSFTEVDPTHGPSSQTARWV